MKLEIGYAITGIAITFIIAIGGYTTVTHLKNEQKIREQKIKMMQEEEGKNKQLKEQQTDTLPEEEASDLQKDLTLCNYAWKFITSSLEDYEINDMLSEELQKQYRDLEWNEPYKTLKGITVYDDYAIHGNKIEYKYKDQWYIFTVEANPVGSKIITIEFDKTRHM